MAITNDPNFISSELRRLEDNLLSFSPSRQWQIVGVSFPTTDTQDVEVRHRLQAANPNNVDVEVLSSNAPLAIFRGAGPWADGLIKLRGTVPGAQAVLLLSVSEGSEDRETPITQTSQTATGNGSPVGLLSNVPLMGYNGAQVGMVGGAGLTWDSFIGSGVSFLDRYYVTTKNWVLGLDAGHGPSDVRLNIADMLAGYVPFMFRQQGGDYFFQPGPQSNAAVNMSLGNPNDAAFVGYWKNVYAGNFIEPGHSAGMGKWASYTPSFFDNAAMAALGNGGISGEYTIIGDTVHFRVAFAPGTTTVVGAGVLGFGLPVAMANWASGRTAIGTAYASIGGNEYSATVFSKLSTLSDCYLMDTRTANGWFSGVFPAALASGDVIAFSGSYRK